jgi:hypothetical protein
MCSHYLNVEGEEWEYKENDRTTGREKRFRIPVPRLLDVNDPSCWTNKWGGQGNEEGEVVVCHPGKGDPRDITFHGDPTPDMIPVDDEARAISATFEHRWSYKPETATSDHSQSLIDRFQVEMAEIKSKPVEIPGLTDLISAIGALVKTNERRI